MITLIILGAASALRFARRFMPVARVILAARPDRGWRFGSTAWRVRDFAWELLLQGKVIRERPLPGLAHAFVFWGFCASALVTIDHLVRGLGFRLLEPEGFGRVYFAVAGVFAVLVAASIAGLAARRFLARPVWLGPVSPESGLTALLTFTLMVAYLATFLFAGGAAASRWNWWVHTAALLVFLPLILVPGTCTWF